MQEMVDASVIAPGIPVERAYDLFLAMTNGITTQHLANEPHLPVGEGRFGGLIPDAIRLFQAAWVPTGTPPVEAHHSTDRDQTNLADSTGGSNNEVDSPDDRAG